MRLARQAPSRRARLSSNVRPRSNEFWSGREGNLSRGQPYQK